MCQKEAAAATVSRTAKQGLHTVRSYTAYISSYIGYGAVNKDKGLFRNHVDIILLFFYHPPTSVDIFYELTVDKNGDF